MYVKNNKGMSRMSILRNTRFAMAMSVPCSTVDSSTAALDSAIMKMRYDAEKFQRMKLQESLSEERKPTCVYYFSECLSLSYLSPHFHWLGRTPHDF
jgi:hypothetical protein